MKGTRFEDMGIIIEKGVNDDTSVEGSIPENADPKQKAILLFPTFGVVPELEDQLEAVNTDPTAMLESLRASNITIEDIPEDDKKKFGLMNDSFHEDHLKQSA